MTTKQMLEQEIRNTIEAVHELEVGSKQHTDAVENYTDARTIRWIDLMLRFRRSTTATG